MTRERIAEGLDLLVLQLANRQNTAGEPDGWLPHEWAYVKGIGTVGILRLRDQLIAPEPRPR